MDPLACARHPDTETYLRCSSCETPICPDCWAEAAVGYQCPACVTSRGASITREDPKPDRFGGLAAGRRGGADPARGSSGGAGERLPTSLAARAGAVGLAAALLGGMLLGPILSEGMLFLISSGAIGWGVARAVYWAAEEASTPYVRAVALTFSGFSAAVGLVVAGTTDAETGVLFLAYPAALYGGWIVVRAR